MIAFQGAHGAYSEMACKQAFPDEPTLPCATFDEAFRAVQEGVAELAMIPVDNTLAGRVADVHRLLPDSGLSIIGETFLPIRHALLAVKGTKLADLREVHSHIHALPQCRKFIARTGLTPVVHSDTAGAAAEVAERQDKTLSAIASELAAEIYNLDILERNIQDADHNATRFLVLSKTPQMPELGGESVITSLVFEVRNIPAALYKALGGFATNNIQMHKLESYIGEGFNIARFYAEIEAHPAEQRMLHAMDELNFYARNVQVLGTYKAHGFRRESHLEKLHP